MRSNDSSPAAQVAESILVVDDDPVILRVMGDVLRGAGYVVLLAEGGWSAIQTFQSAAPPPGLLVTDVVMPQMNGRQLAERLIAARPGLKCLFMSGYSADVIGHRGILTEQMKFIAKPFSLKVLAEKVREVIDH